MSERTIKVTPVNDTTEDTERVILEVKTPDSTSFLHVRLTDEGYVLDVFDKEDDGELDEDNLVTTTYVFDNEVNDVED